MGYFHALKLAFLSSLIRKYMLWEGFYHDFSTKKVSASGGFAPWPPPTGSAPWTPARGRCPLDPRGNFAPSNDLPWRRPWLHLYRNRYCVWNDDLRGDSAQKSNGLEGLHLCMWQWYAFKAFLLCNENIFKHHFVLVLLNARVEIRLIMWKKKQIVRKKEIAREK